MRSLTAIILNPAPILKHMLQISSILILIGIGLTSAQAIEPLKGKEALAERILGNPDAPVTIIEYASLTCPHCASFHRDVLPQLKKDYIDTGKVKLIMRDFPLDRLALSGSMVARCLPAPFYYQALDTLFLQQSVWVQDGQTLPYLVNLAKLVGIDQAGVQACLADQELLDGILLTRQEGDQVYKIRSTPSFIIGDETIQGAQDYDVFKDAIEKNLP